MWILPSNKNYTIEYEMGDGFMTKLPVLMDDCHLLITNKISMNNFKNSKGRCVTIQGLTKLLKNEEIKETCIILDIRIPRVGAKSFDSLRRLCIGRNLIILRNPLFDLKSIRNCMILLSLTKYKLLNFTRWSHHLYNRKY